MQNQDECPSPSVSLTSRSSGTTSGNEGGNSGSSSTSSSSSSSSSDEDSSLGMYMFNDDSDHKLKNSVSMLCTFARSVRRGVASTGYCDHG